MVVRLLHSHAHTHMCDNVLWVSQKLTCEQGDGGEGGADKAKREGREGEKEGGGKGVEEVYGAHHLLRLLGKSMLSPTPLPLPLPLHSHFPCTQSTRESCLGLSIET